MTSVGPPVETVSVRFDASVLAVTPAQSTRGVTGEGTLDVERAGIRLRSGANVNVRGAGRPFDGLLHVNRVRQTITSDSHTQAFELTRAGGGS